MSSLKDVAQMAGVSVSTVSYVINGKKTVKAETHRRIQDAITALDYRPNIIARSLKTNVSKSIGIVVADFSNIFYIDILAGLESTLQKSGYSAIVTNSHNSVEREKANLRELSYRGIDGIILLGTGANTRDAIKELDIPVVSIDRIDDESAHAVVVDNVKGGYLGGKHLLERGRRKIAFIGFADRLSSQDRLEGCYLAFEEFGINAEKNIDYIETDIMPEGGYNAVMKLHGEKGFLDYDGIFAATDYVAYGVVKAVTDLRLNIPEDVAVMGFDDLMLSQYFVPALTSISQPQREMGSEAAKMIIKILAHKGVRRKIVLEPSLVVRETS